LAASSTRDEAPSIRDDDDDGGGGGGDGDDGDDDCRLLAGGGYVGGGGGVSPLLLPVGRSSSSRAVSTTRPKDCGARSILVRGVRLAVPGTEEGERDSVDLLANFFIGVIGITDRGEGHCCC